jgi:RNA 3'-terminal phosphate cyclase (ATP)
MGKVIEIDRAIGGGSVLRLGVPLAIALGYDLRITNVRKFSKPPGLRVQHLTGLNFLTQITGSQIIGANIGSSEIYLTSGKTPPPTNYLPKIQIPTAAAVSLIIQILSNYVFASKKALGFAFEGGGTHVHYSPNFDVLLNVNKPLFQIFGLDLQIQLQKPGFYPKGGALGRVFMKVIPRTHSRVVLTSDNLKAIEVFSSVSSSLRDKKVAELQIRGFKSVIKSPNKVFAGYADSDCPGFACSAVIKYEGNSLKGVARIGDSKISAEENGKLTGKEVLKEIKNKASVDEQLADQLILPLCFAPSGSSYTFDKMYPHVKTNLEVVQTMMGDVLRLERVEESLFLVTKT